MTETQRRIQALKATLPSLRERVIAVALLLVMSAAMMTSASFAWLTISLKPELTGVNTTVAANGNLEIALATGDGTHVPGESAVGDSSATQGQTILGANVTWGNLVNLGDPIYGLNNLILRPAQLNTAALLTSPLYGAVYTVDGRVEKLTSNFGYTAWVPPEGNRPGKFSLSEALGVRAISSTKVDGSGMYYDYVIISGDVSAANGRAASAFEAITKNDTWMRALGNVIGVHMTATLNYEEKYINAEVAPADLQALIAMYEAFLEAYRLEAEAVAQMLYLQTFLGRGSDVGDYIIKTPEEILTMSTSSGFTGNNYTALIPGSANKHYSIKNLKTLISDYKMLKENVEYLRKIDQSGDRRWSFGTKKDPNTKEYIEFRTIEHEDGTKETFTGFSLKSVVEKLVYIDTCLVSEPGGGGTMRSVKTLMNTFNSDISAAMDYLGKEAKVEITNGVLYNFSQRTGAKIEVAPRNMDGKGKTGIPVSATMYVDSLRYEQSATIYGTITTSAKAPAEFSEDLDYASYDNKDLTVEATGGSVDITAEDTYGLAVDLWVRTNAESSYLGLEGNVLTKPREVDATTKDANGNTVPLYTLTRTETMGGEDVFATDPATGENVGEPVGTSPVQSVPVTYELYKVEVKDGNNTITTWYNASTYTEFTLQANETPTLKKLTVYDVIGFEGENRVWDKGDMISTDATTQGSGSCYVYYADTPEDQARSLELLKAFNVAFVDEDGKLLAVAKMATELHYAEAGRVTVPLKLTSGVLMGTDDFGSSVYAITALEKNVPKRITAIVFLDGTLLNNEDVLSAAEIQGQLNIQFGSSVDLQAINHEALENTVRSVSASVDKTSFNFDTDTDLTATVTVQVYGDAPKNVEAYFIRKINAAQGTREPVPMVFEDNGDGTWSATYKFTAPGNYILRTIRLDGVDYDLPVENMPEIEVKGFTVEKLVCDKADANRHISVMTNENSERVKMTLKFAANDVSKMPKTVSGRFLRDEDGAAVNVRFDRNTDGTWTGDATFLASGNYTFQYLILDGRYQELPEDQWQTATVYLGMRVAIYTTSPTNFKFERGEIEADEKKMLLGLQVIIMDNSGKEMPGLTDAVLTYSAGTRTLDANLKWDPSGYYVGELQTLLGGPGEWKFTSVYVNGNTLTNATTAPVFKMFAPEPPSYLNCTIDPDNYVFYPDGGAFMNVDLKYTDTATVFGRLVQKDRNGNVLGEHLVQGSKTNNTSTDEKNGTVWKFVIPTNNNGKQDGYWTLADVRIWDYYDAAGNYVSYEPDPDTGEQAEPLLIDMEDKNYWFKVVQSVEVVFADNSGNADKELSGTFLQEHSFYGANVDIYDFEGEPLKNVSEVTLEYAYDGNTAQYGKYTSSQISAMDGLVVKLNTKDATGKNFSQGADQARTEKHAGVYSPAKLQFKVGSKLYTKTDLGTLDKAPTVTIRSSNPTVEVTGTDPAKGTTKRVYTVKKPTTTNQMITGDFSSYTKNTATVYIYANTSGGVRDQEAVQVKAPTVTLKLANVPSGYSSATMLFVAKNSDSVNSEFKFSNGTATAPVGRAVEGSFGILSISEYPECYPAGTMTQNKITITYGDFTYEVTLTDTITIDNPLSPTALVFAGIPDSFTGTKPAQVIGTGSMVTVTLPELHWNARIEEPRDGTWSAYTAVGEVDAENTRVMAYTSYKYLAVFTRYNYQYFYWTQFESHITAETDIYTQDKGITKWLINGVVYNAGQTLTLTSDSVITATAIVTDESAKNFVETVTQTTYKYLYGYVAQTAQTGKSSLPALPPKCYTTTGNTTSWPQKPLLANQATADAVTDKPGTNMTTDPSLYTNYQP